MVQQDQQNFCQDYKLKPLDHEDVRILFLGDSKVGKTSIIHTLANDEFQYPLPCRMTDIVIPPSLIPEDVSIRIVDYSSSEQSPDDLQNCIKDANVICVVYTAGDDFSLDYVADYWLPMIRKCQDNCVTKYMKPIILVANKIDLVEQEGRLDRVTALIQDFIEIEAYIGVSALEQKNVVELIQTAKNAVLYPLLPLFDPHKRVLTNECRGALIDIFKLCDLDGDGLLSDHELNLFQWNCFGTPLQKDSLDDLKSIIKQTTMDGIINDSMTQTGFLFLHTLSIDKGRHDFTWQVLRKFNYDNKLRIKNQHSPDVDELIDEFSQINSLSNLTQTTEISNGDSDSLSHVDPSWAGEHSSLIKAGFGLTLATLVSMLALKFLMNQRSR